MHRSLNETGTFSSLLKVIHIRKKDESRALTIKDVARIFLHLNYKTLHFNFRYFRFSDAIKFPVFVKNGSHLNKMNGAVTIEGAIRPGMILLGYGDVGHIDKTLSKLIWDVDGNVIFKGRALLKFGCKIVVGKEALLEFGDMFRISSNSSILCFKKIVFGKNCRLSWDVQVMDTDFHKIKTLTGELLNPPKEIIIGDHVWIGSKALIKKGSRISDDCIVASNSVVTKIMEGSHQIIAGMPAKVVRTGVTWDS
jgi:acetyltransferase-like isoleucine patch superfamily enzyme